MPHIVVLDGHTTNPEPNEKHATAEGADVSWAPLAEHGELVVYPRTAGDQVAERIGEATIVLTNKTPLDEAVLAACPALRYIGVLATGVNVVDLTAAAKHDVTVTNVPGYSTDSVAQHVFALLLSMTSKAAEHDQAVHEGRWASCEDFSFTTAPLIELSGLTLGVVGMGAIGQAVARIGYAMGMQLAAHSRTERDIGLPVRWLEIDALFAASDVVTLHCPLTQQTQGMVDADRLKSMKRSAYLINTGRGPLIDEQALADALNAGTIAGAGLDVLSAEPPGADNPLLAAKHCVITPHVAWATIASRRRLVAIAAQNLRGFLDGQPVNVVS